MQFIVIVRNANNFKQGTYCNVSVSFKHYHSLGNSGANFKNLSNPGHPGKFYFKCLASGLPDTLYFNVFTLLHLFQDLNR